MDLCCALGGSGDGDGAAAAWPAARGDLGAPRSHPAAATVAARRDALVARVGTSAPPRATPSWAEAEAALAGAGRLASELGGPFERMWGALTKSGDENALRVTYQMGEHLRPLLMGLPRDAPIVAPGILCLGALEALERAHRLLVGQLEPAQRLDHATPLFPLRGIEQRLQALGYQVMRVNAILFHLKWDGAIDLAVDHLHVARAPRSPGEIPGAAR